VDDACQPLPAPAPPVRVALVGEGPGTRLAVEVVCAELRRRLPGADIGPLHAPVAAGPATPTRSGLPDVLVSDTVSESAAGEGAPSGDRIALDGGAEGRLPTPTLLADRIWDPAILDGRVERLRLTGALPATGAILLGAFLDEPSPSDTRLAALASAEGLDPVRLDPVRLGSDDLRPGATVHASQVTSRHLAPADPLDLAAACRAAGVVVADDPHLAGLALALGRPTVALAAGGRRGPGGGRGTPYGWPAGAVVVDDIERVAGALGPARARASHPAERDPARQRLDEALDAVAAGIRRLVADRPAPAHADLVARIAVLEGVARGLEDRLRAERLAFAAAAAEAPPHPPEEDDRKRLWAQREVALAAEATARADVEQAHREAAVIGGALQAAAAAIGQRDAELTRLSRAHSASLAELGSLRPQLTDGRAVLQHVTAERDEARRSAERAAAELARLEALPGQRALRLLHRVLGGLRPREG
jgi:hypothetical protein